MKVKDSAGLTNLHPIFSQALAPFFNPDLLSSYPQPANSPTWQEPSNALRKASSSPVSASGAAKNGGAV
jgi:hypothetical protein